jgi:hypothetical protein
MKIRLAPKQQMWADVFRCAIERSNIYFKENDLDRHAREHSTAMLALQKGEKFWKELV